MTDCKQLKKQEIKRRRKANEAYRKAENQTLKEFYDFACSKKKRNAKG